MAFFFQRRWGFHDHILFYLTPTASKWLKSIIISNYKKIDQLIRGKGA